MTHPAPVASRRIILDGSPEDLALRDEFARQDAAKAAQCENGVRLWAQIRARSKYAGQTKPGERFRVAIVNDQPSGYVVAGGPGGRYRLEDVRLFAEAVDGVLIALSAR